MNNLIPAKTNADHVADGLAMGLSKNAADLYASYKHCMRNTPVNEHPYAFDAFVAQQQGLARDGHGDATAIDELIMWRRGSAKVNNTAGEQP